MPLATADIMLPPLRTLFRAPALITVAAILAGVLFMDQEPARVEAYHLCPSTGSPFGPFDMQAYEASDYKNVYARTMELAGFNQLFPDVASFAMPQLEYGDRSAGSSWPGDKYIPPVLLKAIAWIESNWAQADASVPYGAVGPTLISADC